MTGSVRQAARRAAQERQAAMRRDREQTERRLAAAGVRVAIALGERAAQERRAGAALQEMTTELGVPLREALTWTGTQLSLAEARRLLRLAEPGEPETSQPAGQTPTGLAAGMAPTGAGERAPSAGATPGEQGRSMPV